MLLASGERRPGMLLDLSHWTGEALTTKNCLVQNANIAEVKKPCSNLWLWHQLALWPWASAILSLAPFWWFFLAPPNPVRQRQVLLYYWHLYSWDWMAQEYSMPKPPVWLTVGQVHILSLSLTSSFTHCRQTILGPSHTGQFGKTQPQDKWAVAKQCHIVLLISIESYDWPNKWVMNL